MRELFEAFIKFITSRLFILSVVVIVLFGFMISRLFELQIIKGEEYLNNFKGSIIRTLDIAAPRGTIYDAYSRPLAINNVSFAVKIDSSISNKLEDEEKNKMYLNLIKLLEKNGDKVIDELPISTTKPYTFLFGGDTKKEVKWKVETLGYTKGIENINNCIDSIGMIEPEYMDKVIEANSSVTAEDIMTYLESDKMFDTAKLNLNDEDNRKLISLRYSIYLKRFFQYQPITIALEVCDKTVAVLEEENDYYKGVFIDSESLRVYPEGGLFSHIIGYTRAMDAEEFNQYKYYAYTKDENGNVIVEKTNDEKRDKNKTYVYSSTDIVGKTGLEKSFELELNGVDGKTYVEVDSKGRTTNTIQTLEEAIPGKKIYLTIDRDLNEVAFNVLYDQIKNTLLNKINSGIIGLKDIFSSMVNVNRVSISSIWNSKDGDYQYIAKTSILNKDPNFELDIKDNDSKSYAKEIICDAIKSGEISSKSMFLILCEQKIINCDENYIQKIENGMISPMTGIKDKINNNELTPQDIAIEPYSGSVTVTDVKTGKVLAMVTYPTYDNNELVNSFNNEYYNKINNDLTSPMINRSLYEKDQPGSTFKMITALAGLETGVITPNETIYARGTYDKAGRPYASCWLWNQRRGMHGSINVSKALEVSCNYFFYEVAYRMGNASSENRLQGIETLNKYISLFGLDNKTGVEIGEAMPNNPTPEYKEAIEKSRNPNAIPGDLRWNDGDTIRAAIGQSLNGYTTANMAKYIATLADGKNRYKLTLIDKIEDNNGNTTVNKPVIEEKLDLKQENLQVVYEGMHDVTKGPNGTVSNSFKDYPIDVAGKSGTAQHNSAKPDHTWFVGFAPYEDPQISIAVVIPSGDFRGTTPAAEVAKSVIASYMGLDLISETKTMDNILSK